MGGQGHHPSLRMGQQCTFMDNRCLRPRVLEGTPLCSVWAWWDTPMLSTGHMEKSWPGRLASCNIQVWRRGFILWEVCCGGSHSDPWSSSALPEKRTWMVVRRALPGTSAHWKPSLVTHSRPSVSLTHVSLTVDIEDNQITGSSAISSIIQSCTPPEHGQGQPSVIL